MTSKSSLAVGLFLLCSSGLGWSQESASSAPAPVVAAASTEATAAPTPAASSPAPAAAPSFPIIKTDNPTYIILKLDDLKKVTPQWQRVVDFAKEKNIKINIGIICDCLEADNVKFFDWIKDLQKTGMVEFWNHGYDHKMWKENNVDVQEFKGTPYEQQKEHFSKAQQLAKDKLGITMHAFGSPFNAVDDNTLRVLSEDPDVKVLLFGDKKMADKIPNIMILDRCQMNIENPLFLPNSTRIQQDYEKLAGKRECFVLQGHPNNWAAPERWDEFVKLVEYLQAQGVVFTTPTEYYELKKKNGN
jgi:peptidoglycan/xylan/chitin deacetylase (PgdA/CDA1 family)